MSSVEYGLIFIGFLQQLLLFLLAPLFWYLRQKPSQKVPPIKDELLLKSATYLAKNIREGKIKSEDVIRAYIKRIEDVNPIVNGVVKDSFTTAIETAISVDEYIAKKIKTPEEIEKDQPLLGVPISIKETCRVKGMPHTCLTLLRKDVVADNDGFSVGLIRKAGAIPLAVTNTPELSLNWETNNLIVGRTLNPYNTNYTSGGSSGGESALIASAASVIGLGSDVAGSIRLPALFSGIYGHKPTPRVNSIDGLYPSSSDEAYFDYLTVGPLVRYSEDLKLVMSVLDHQKLLKLDEAVDVTKLNIFYKEDAGYSIVGPPVNDEIKQLIRLAKSYLQRIGSKVAPANFVDMSNTLEIGCSNFSVIQNLPNLLQCPDNPKEYRNIYLEILKSIFGLTNISFDVLKFQLMMYLNFFIPKSKLPKYQRELAILKKQFIDNLGTNGVFLYPTYHSSAFQHNQAYLRIFGVKYTMIFNVLGFPGTHVTMGLDKTGLPIGIQVVAAPHQDRLCLAVAQELEKQFGGWIPPTEVSV